MSDHAIVDRAVKAESWEEYDRLRAAWLSRLMFGGFVRPEPMVAGPPPEPPDEDTGL